MLKVFSPWKKQKELLPPDALTVNKTLTMTENFYCQYIQAQRRRISLTYTVLLTLRCLRLNLACRKSPGEIYLLCASLPHKLPHLLCILLYSCWIRKRWTIQSRGTSTVLAESWIRQYVRILSSSTFRFFRLLESFKVSEIASSVTTRKVFYFQFAVLKHVRIRYAPFYEKILLIFFCPSFCRRYVLFVWIFVQMLNYPFVEHWYFPSKQVLLTKQWQRP